MTQSLQFKPVKPVSGQGYRNPRKRRRLEFAKARRDWTVQDWRRVLFTGESPFELYHPPNRKNDRVWTQHSADLPPTATVTKPLKIVVWGNDELSRAVRPAHHARGRTVTADYIRG